MNKSGSIILAGALGAAVSFGMVKVFDKEETKVIVKEVTSEVSTPENTTFHQASNRFFAYPDVSSSELDFTKAAEETVNGVVHIKTVYTSQYTSDPFLDFFWGPGGSHRPQTASGSGVIISKDGYIATNNHVIEDADEIEVTMNDGTTLTAEVVGTDPSTDLALIKVKTLTDLPFVSFGNSDDVKIGEWVLAVGNPFNLTSTVTAGIVSAKSRSINLLKSDFNKDIFPIESFIQTDAAVNPGNSGGALVSPDGKLVGINTAIASRTGSYAGYSFAVPSNIVKKVTQDLMEYGIVQRAFIGVSLQNIDKKTMEDYELPNPKGVLVTGIAPDGAAQSAGIKDGDVILRVGTVNVNKVPELQEQIGKFRPGDRVTLNVRSGNEVKDVILTLKNIDGNTSVVDKEATVGVTALGASFKTVSAQEMKTLKIKNGVKVTELGPGKLRSSGISEGFIITKIDQKPVDAAEDVVAYLNKKKGGVLIEGIYENGMKGYFGFGL